LEREDPFFLAKLSIAMLKSQNQVGLLIQWSRVLITPSYGYCAKRSCLLELCFWVHFLKPGKESV
jgi:hypothetical protein